MPKIEQKQLVVKEIKERLEKAASVVLLDARGLTVEQDTSLRKKLREAGVYYKIYKNTMLTLAVKGTAYEGLTDFFKGPTAAAFSYDDPTCASRLIHKDLKALPALSFKAGVLDGVLYDEKAMTAVAGIPPKDELLSKLLGSFKSPMASFARVIQAVADKQA
ncbi:MAG: 50S ribosomal protein L10 [Clostridiales bacterium]|jgi:large subunit ribosomal protein L10|nr:50S ribosomal protein L10 [Clostridiales bacterium]